MKNTLASLVLFSLFFAIPSLVAAQNNSPDAHLTGTLLDSSGGGVDGVQVTAQLEGAIKADTWSATSNGNGGYALVFPAGRYRVRYMRPPFVSRDFILDFSPGQRRTMDLKLELEPLSSSVVVTAQAAPTPAQNTTAPVTIITREEIDARQAVLVSDVLLYSPGVAISRTGSGGGTTSVFLDGGNSNFTKVLVDGTPINTPGGAVDFSNLTLDDVDKIEIVRGAESAIYGTDAVSGVIQIFTHRGTTRVPQVDIFGEGGTFTTARGGAQVSGLLNAFDYSAAASYLQSAGQGINNDFLNRSMSGNFGYRFSENNEVRLAVRDNNSEAGIPGQVLFQPPLYNSHQRFDQRVSAANLRWNFASGTHWKHQLAAAESYTEQTDFSPTFGNSRFTYNRMNLDGESSYLLPKLGVTAGYQYEIENAGLPFLAPTHVHRNNQGGFLDFYVRPHPRASINFGARAEANANFGTRVVPRVGASLALRYGVGLWGDTRYRIFYGQGIKEPRLDQNYNDQFGNYGNPTLKPEASKNWSTGIEQKLFDDRVKFSADYFSNRFYNVISFAFCTPSIPPATGNTCGINIPGAPSSFGYFFNSDRARARGVNLAVETRPQRWVSFAGNYSYDDSRVLAAPNAFDPAFSTGNRLIRRPVNSGSLTMNAAIRQFTVTIAGYFTGVRTDSDFLGKGLTRDPGYARFDLAARYQPHRGLSLYARATNLFNKSYQDALGYPALGRDVRVGMNYRFGGSN